MEFTKKRKIYILVGMFVLLAVTGYLNFTLNNSSSTVGGGAYTNTSLFTMFRQTRTDERTASIAILESIAASESGYTAEAKAEAAQQLLTLLANIQFENTCEGLILAQSYEDAIVSKTNDNVNVLIKKAENITKAEAATILSILRSVNTDLDVENVFISIIE